MAVEGYRVIGEGRRPSKKKGEGGPEVAVMPPITFSTGQADHKHPPLKFTVIVTALLTLHSLDNFGKTIIQRCLKPSTDLHLMKQPGYEISPACDCKFIHEIKQPFSTERT